MRNLRAVHGAEYLGSDQPNFTLNFSKSASMIIGQYYQFVRLGFEGYKKIMASLLNVAARLQEGIEKLGMLSSIACLRRSALCEITRAGLYAKACSCHAANRGQHAFLY